MRSNIAFFVHPRYGSIAQAMKTVRLIEDLGFGGAFLVSHDRDSRQDMDNLLVASWLLDSTDRILIGTAVTNIYMRHPHTIASAGLLLEERYPGRLIIGLGVSHQSAHEHAGTTPGHPLEDMRNYLNAIDYGAGGRSFPKLVLGALGPKMTDLGITAGDGVIRANGTRDDIANLIQQGAQHGSRKWFANSAPIAISDDTDRSLDRLRDYMQFYLSIDHYRRYYSRMGFASDVKRAHSSSGVGPQASDALCAAVGVSGNGSGLASGIRTWLATGVDMLILDPVDFANLDDDAYCELIRRLADVIPEDEIR